MKIVVIGGSGLIGRGLVTLLKDRGHEVLSASPASGVNAVTGEGLDGLLLALTETLPDPPVHVEALVPWDRGDLVAMLYREAEVLSATAEPEGTRVEANVGLRALAALRTFLTKPAVSLSAATAPRSTAGTDPPSGR